VIGIVSRFAAQKGFDLIAQIADRLAREEMTLVILGSGDKVYEDTFARLNKHFPARSPSKSRNDNVIAHKIEAGADMFLMPSRYEPCGLNQILQPEVRHRPHRPRTGGLDDTIEPWDARTGKGTGFKFTEIQRRIASADDQAGADSVPRSKLRGRCLCAMAWARIFPGMPRRGSMGRFTSA